MTPTIVQLSDIHIPAQGRLFGEIDTEARLARTLDRLLASAWDVDMLLVTGDVADHGEPASYRRAAPLLRRAADRLGAQLVCIPGNHDDVGAFARHLLHPDLAEGPIDSVAWIGDLRVIGLDSTVAGAHHGALGEAQLDRLAGLLEEPAAEGTILALHHPPVPSPLAVLADLQLHDPERLAEVIRGSDVRVVLCGHDHHVGGGALAGVPVWVAPSMAYTIDALGADGRIQGTADGAITIVQVHPDTVVTTQIPVLDPIATYVVDEDVGAMLDAYGEPSAAPSPPG